MADGFKIVLPPQANVLEDVWAKIKQYSEGIVAEASRMLAENLPEWPVVEAAIVEAYDRYIRVLDIPYVPNFIEGKLDDWLCAQLVATIKKIYDDMV